MTKEARIYNGERTICSISGVGKSGHLTCKRMNLQHFFTPYTKINSKWIKSKYKTRNHKTPIRKNRQHVLWNWSQQHFFGSVSLGKGNRSKNKQRGPNQLKNFCTEKGTINKMKRQPTEWEKIFANDMSYKGLLSKICKEILQLNFGKQNNLIFKGAENLNKHFSKEDTHMANRHMKRCSISLIREP